MITKGFFLTKENNRIGAIILRDHQILKATAAAKRFQGGQPPREDDAYALAALSPDSQAVHFPVQIRRQRRLDDPNSAKPGASLLMLHEVADKCPERSWW